MIKEQSPAKVNLILDIVGRRSDGYHEMRMINHSIGLADVLTFSQAETFVLTCNDPHVPLGEKNLVWKAAETLREFSGCALGARIHIEKNIPMEAGLAGGSANAAATLRGLNRLWGLDLSLEKLQEIGAHVGADVPYCVVNGTALVEGVGDKVTPLSPLPSYPMVVVKPHINIATPMAFAMADEDLVLYHPDVVNAAQVIETEGLENALTFLGNSFETSVFKRWPVIGAVKDFLKSAGAFYAAMSGSGSTVVGYFKNLETAEKIGERLTQDGHSVFVTRVL